MAYSRLAKWKLNYGPMFTLEWRGACFPVKVYKFNGEWRIQYHQPKQYTSYIPFALEINLDSPNSVHIHNIHKTQTHSGTQLVHLALSICKKLGATEATLEDAAYVPCAKNRKEMRLSLIHLIKHGRGFYEQFGFTPYPKTRRQQTMRTVKKLQKVQLATVRAKIRDALNLLKAARREPDHFELVQPGEDGYPDIYVPNPHKHIARKLRMVQRIYDRMNKSACARLVDFLYLCARHKSDCAIYTMFFNLAHDDHLLQFKEQQVSINKWSKQLAEIEEGYPSTMRITF